MLHDPGGVGRVAVARDGHEVDLAGHGQVPHQVGHEEDGALEHADQQQVAALVVGRDLGAELGHARGERLPVDQDLADRALELGLAHARSAFTPGASTRPGTATTSRPRTTRGHASRSDRGILASTNTSWTFLRRPASLSPGRQLRTLRPASSDSIVHGPQRTRPSSATGVCSSQTRSYSRTAVRPWPRSIAARALGRGEQQVEPRRPLLGETQQVLLGARVETPQQRQQLLADQAAARVRVRAVAAGTRAPRRGSRPRSPRARASAAAGRPRPRASA